MKVSGISADSAKRQAVDLFIREFLKKAIDNEDVTLEEVAFLLVRMAVELEDEGHLQRGQVLGNIVGAYALRGVDIDNVLEQLRKLKEEITSG